MWFYFSSLMDKLGRSLGLIGLGILRRRLGARIYPTPDRCRHGDRSRGMRAIRPGLILLLVQLVLVLSVAGKYLYER